MRILHILNLLLLICTLLLLGLLIIHSLLIHLIVILLWAHNHLILLLGHHHSLLIIHNHLILLIIHYHHIDILLIVVIKRNKCGLLIYFNINYLEGLRIPIRWLLNIILRNGSCTYNNRNINVGMSLSTNASR